MTLITLKFSPEMERLIMSGKKCCTTKDTQKGSPGDVFRVNNRLYLIVTIHEEEFDYVDFYYNLEGFKTREHFIDILTGIYPALVSDDTLFIHFFAYLGELCHQFGILGGKCVNGCELYEECEKCRHQNSVNQKSATS